MKKSNSLVSNKSKQSNTSKQKKPTKEQLELLNKSTNSIILSSNQQKQSKSLNISYISDPNKLITSDPFPSFSIQTSLFQNDNDLISDCCVQCANRNIIRAVNTNNKELFIQCLKAKDKISSINEGWSDDHPISPFYVATMRKNLSFISKYIKYLTKKKHSIFHYRVQKPSSKLGFTSSGGVSNRTYGRQVSAVTMTRGSREGNNAFIGHSLNRDYKLDFVNALIQSEDTELFQLLKVIGYENRQYETFNYSRRGKSSQIKSITIDENDIDNETNLYKAASAGSNILASFILSEMIGVEGKGYNKHHLEALTLDKTQITFRPSVNKKSEFSVTPIHFACINPSNNILRYLVDENDNGGDIHFLDCNLKAPIHYAAASSTLVNLKYLIEEKNVNLDHPDKTKTTPLMYACKYGRYINVKYLLEKGANASRKNKSKDTAFILAAANGHTDIVKLFIETYSFKISSFGADKFTALHYAAIQGNEKLLGFLIVKQIKLNLRDRHGRTALILAAKNGQSRIVDILIKLKDDPNQTDSSNNTPLHYALAFGWKEIAETLIEAGGDVNRINIWGTSPVELCYSNSHLGLLMYLIRKYEGPKSVNVNRELNSGITLLQSMCQDIDKKISLKVERTKQREFLINSIIYLAFERQALPVDLNLMKNNLGLVKYFIINYPGLDLNMKVDVPMSHTVKKDKEEEEVIYNLLDYYLHCYQTIFTGSGVGVNMTLITPLTLPTQPIRTTMTNSVFGSGLGLGFGSGFGTGGGIGSQLTSLQTNNATNNIALQITTTNDDLIDIIQFLVKHKLKINTLEKVIHHLDLVKFLLQQTTCIKINKKLITNKTTLFEFYFRNLNPDSLDIIRYLLRTYHELDVTLENKSETVFHLIAKLNFDNYLANFTPPRGLLSGNILQSDFEEQITFNKNLPALKAKHYEMIKELMLLFKDKTIDINDSDSKGNTALNIAIINRNLPFIDILMSNYSIDLLYVNDRDETVLSILSNIVFDSLSLDEIEENNTNSKNSQIIVNQLNSASNIYTDTVYYYPKAITLCNKLIENLNIQLKQYNSQIDKEKRTYYKHRHRGMLASLPNIDGYAPLILIMKALDTTPQLYAKIKH